MWGCILLPNRRAAWVISLESRKEWKPNLPSLVSWYSYTHTRDSHQSTQNALKNFDGHNPGCCNMIAADRSKYLYFDFTFKIKGWDVPIGCSSTHSLIHTVCITPFKLYTHTQKLSVQKIRSVDPDSPFILSLTPENVHDKLLQWGFCVK